MTLILSGSDVAALLDPGELVEALRSGFLGEDAPGARDARDAQDARNGQDGQAQARWPGRRVRADLPGGASATALFPGLLAGIPAYTVKINAKFPGAEPALRGVVCLHSLADGRLLAVLDSARLTAWRTGLAAALATDVLAAPEAGAVGVVGAGAQADLVLAGLSRLRPITRLTVTDLVPERARRFAERHGGSGAGTGGLVAEVVQTPAEVAAASAIVVLATWSRAPLLRRADVRPGQHLTTLGVDEPGKCELAADVLRAATVVVDQEDLARQGGVLAADGLQDVRPATLGQVLAGVHPGRTGPGDLTVYAPVGLPWQDLAAAWTAYQAAVAQGRGLEVDLLA